MSVLHCWLKTKNRSTWQRTSSHRQLWMPWGATQLLRVAQQGLQQLQKQRQQQALQTAGAPRKRWERETVPVETWKGSPTVKRSREEKTRSRIGSWKTHTAVSVTN